MSDNTVEVTPPSYKITLKGDGVTIDKEIAEDTAREVVALIMGGTVVAPSAAPVRSHGQNQEGSVRRGDKSSREFLDEVGAKKNPELITAIGQMLFDQGIETFNSSDLKTQFRGAGEVTPANLGRDIRTAQSSGWIAADPSDAMHFYVTDAGRRAIAGKFEGAKIRRPTPRRRRTTTKETDVK